MLNNSISSSIERRKKKGTSKQVILIVMVVLLTSRDMHNFFIWFSLHISSKQAKVKANEWVREWNIEYVFWLFVASRQINIFIVWDGKRFKWTFSHVNVSQKNHEMINIAYEYKNTQVSVAKNDNIIIIIKSRLFKFLSLKSRNFNLKICKKNWKLTTSENDSVARQKKKLINHTF